MIFDTHSHCYWDILEPCIDEIVSNMYKNWVTKAVQIGCDEESSLKAISLAQRFPWVFYATVWLHPETAQDRGGYISIEKYEALIIEHREYIVAVGETGFDHHYLTPGKESEQKSHQQAWFVMQWELASRYNLPLVIHTRDARDKTLEFMKEQAINRCVMHCFSEDWEFARELLEFSSEIYFSFSGIVTYKNAPKIQEAAMKIPLNRILIETDAPFLAPQAVRGSVNEPANTRYILEKICELRTESSKEIEDVIYENSLRFYRLSS